ncbi:MAG: hypothetical protein ABEI39_06650 [Halobacteriales archaeon]
MSQREQAPYGFGEDLPLEAVDPATTLMVSGSTLSNAAALARALVLAGNDAGEGMLFVSTNTASGKLLSQSTDRHPALDTARVGIVDCTEQGSGDPDSGARIETLSTPGDLTGIGIEFSKLYRSLHEETGGRVRTGLITVSTLLMYSELRTLFRFIHTVSGRIEATGGLGVLVIDPTSHEDQAVSTLGQLCDGRIEVREPESGDADGELRVRGLPDQPGEWTPFGL